MIEELFREKGIKNTKSRSKIYELIAKHQNITIKEIINKCSSDMNTTTIYRIIDTFLEKGIIDKKVSIDNVIYYEIKPLDHSHYINCIKCHRKEKINDIEIHNFEEKVSKDYQVLSHEISFYGICSECEGKNL